MSIQDYHFKLGINLSMIFTEVPLLERFALAKQMGFDTVEIQFPYELRIEQIQQQLQYHDLTLCLINVPAGDLMQGGLGLACVPDRVAEYHQAVELALQYAQALNVKKINVLSGRVSHVFSDKACEHTFVENLNYTVKQAERVGVAVMIEMINPTDMPHFYLQDFETVENILNQVNLKNKHAVSLQFDCYHVAKIGQDVLASLRKYLPVIQHIQFADSPHRHEPNTGNLNFSEIFQWLEDNHYQGDVCAEYRPSGHSLQSFHWLDDL